MDKCDNRGLAAAVMVAGVYIIVYIEIQQLHTHAHLSTELLTTCQFRFIQNCYASNAFETH